MYVPFDTRIELIIIIVLLGHVQNWRVFTVTITSKQKYATKVSTTNSQDHQQQKMNKSFFLVLYLLEVLSDSVCEYKMKKIEKIDQEENPRQERKPS